MSKFTDYKMEIKVGLNQYITQINRADGKSDSNPIIPFKAVETILNTANNVVNIKSPELTKLEKEMVLNCIKYQIKHFENEQYRLEKEYDKLQNYDPDYESRILAVKDSQKYYTDLCAKLDKII